MTHRTNPDTRRALDAVAPPDQWDDIVARSRDAEVLDLAEARDRGRGRWVLGAAAAVLVLLVAAVGVVALRGDGDDDGDRVASEGGSSPWGERWRLESLAAEGADWPLIGLDGRSPVLDLSEEGTVAYRACNSGSGEGRVVDGRLVLTDGFMMTVAACIGDDEASAQGFMEQESFVTELLGDRPTVVRDADLLVLTADDGREARFGRIDERDPSTMFGRRWTAVAVTVDGRPRDLHAAGGLVLQFGGSDSTEATFPGMACVPPYQGPVAGDAWSPHATATIDCGPPGTDERNDWLNRLLAHPGVTAEAGDPVPLTVDVDGDRLTLSHDAARFEFVASQNPEGLVGKTWTVARIEQDGVEREVLTNDDAEVITFRVAAAGGGTRPGQEVLLGGGCNGKSASATVDVDRLVVPDSFGSTMKLCNGPGPTGDALLAQDEWFTTFLAADPLVAFQGDRLTLWTADRRVELAGDGSIGAPIDGRGGDPGEGPDGSTTETTTGPDGSIGGPIGSSVPVEPVDAPEGPDDLWDQRWLVTAIVVDGFMQPMVPTGSTPWLTVDLTVAGELGINGGCHNPRFVRAEWAAGRLIADGVASSERDCAADVSRQEQVVADAVAARPRLVGFVDALGSGWVVDAGSTTVELRREVLTADARFGCGPTDARTVEVSVGERSSWAVPLSIRVLQGDDELGTTELSAVSADDGATARSIEVSVDPARGWARVEVVPKGRPDLVLGMAAVEDLGISCG